MATDRRVGEAVPQQAAAPGIEDLAGAPPAAPAHETARLDHVPTQRGALPAPAPAEAERPARRRGRTLTLAVALAVTAALVATVGVVQHERDVHQAQRLAAGVRVAAAVSVRDADARRPDPSLAGGTAAWSNAVTLARTAATDAATGGATALDATPHAGDAPRAALQAAVDAARAVAADPDASLVRLTAATAALAAPVKAAQDAEAAWQAAEAARIAAEQAAAAQKAAQEAAAKAAAQKAAAQKAGTSKKSTKASSGTAPAAGAAAAPAAAAPSGIPSGGLVCPGAPTGGGAGESSVDAIGAAINAYRESQGLPTLAVSRSGSLVAHAQDMAAAGGIWHSGHDNIVGCTSGSVQSLLNAWAHSAPHNKQMLRTDVSSMAVGGASVGGWLYGAVKFS
jgi:hypothetical protein